MGYVDFPAKEIGLSRIYESTALEGYANCPLDSSRIEEIYGKLLFPPYPPDRTYTFGSFVSSIDGRIAFPESPDGTLIAKTNRYDSYGGLCDYWILTMLRAAADAVLMGSLTIKREPELTARIADRGLEEARLQGGRAAVPLHVVVTRSGKNVPTEHQIFTSPDIPALIASSASGREELFKKLSGGYRDLGLVETEAGLSELPKTAGLEGGSILNENLSILGVGEGETLDTALLVKVLKRLGVNVMLVESPTFLVSLMQESLLNELYLNTSGLFVGGRALTIGENAPAFSPEEHPHTRTLSIHSHGDHFFYTRYSFIYD